MAGGCREEAGSETRATAEMRGAEFQQLPAANGNRSRRALLVEDVDLGDVVTRLHEKHREKQRRREGVGRSERPHGVPGVGADDLERNVGVVERHAEKAAQGRADDGRQPEPNARIVTLPADAERGVFRAHGLPECGEGVERDLTITVDEEDKRARGRVESRAKGRAVSGVGLMKHAQARLAHGEVVEKRAGAVAAAVVNDDQFGVGHDEKDVRLHVAHGVGDRCFLVVGGHHDAERRPRGRYVDHVSRSPRERFGWSHHCRTRSARIPSRAECPAVRTRP